MPVRNLVCSSVLLLLSACACPVSLRVSGDELHQAIIGVDERARIVTLEVLSLDSSGKETLLWRIEGPGELGVYYGKTPAEFATVHGPERLIVGQVYRVRVTCALEGGRRCTHTQLFGMLRPSLPVACENRAACESLMVSEVTSR